MPWSQPDPDHPWGRRPQGAPPDPEEIIRRMRERLGGFGGGGGAPSGAALGGAAALLFALWVASGFYTVAADEAAVVLRFGKHVATTGPGLHWHLPYPIEQVEKVPVTRIQRIEIGFRLYPDGAIRRLPSESLMLTKDENVVDLAFIVQYRVQSPEDFLFNINHRRAAKTVRDAAESAMREVIGRTLIDDVLTTKKAEVEQQTQELLQKILDGYKSGIQIVTVKLQDVQPPKEVIKEFKDVASAREDMERAKNEAQAYANDIIPKARGEAQKMRLDAEAYRAEVVARARGEAARFEKLVAEYKQAPDVVRRRLYLETMEEVFAKARKIVVDSAVADRVLPYLPLDALRGKVEVK
ncbi:MAG: FtsH protease activity modulator HflK [Zetaproteobacteria bacterium]|nr:MAG: FtsH protease activity modulator HflK [Zetaproteobacteria bacterium]